MTAYSAKFVVGQEVFCVGAGWADRDVHCATCGDTGKVEISGTVFDCPGCQGRGKRRASVRADYVADYGPVSRVQVTDTDDEPASVTYMLRAQSGTVWDADDVFATRDEAEAACRERNDAAYEGVRARDWRFAR